MVALGNALGYEVPQNITSPNGAVLALSRRIFRATVIVQRPCSHCVQHETS